MLITKQGEAGLKHIRKHPLYITWTNMKQRYRKRYYLGDYDSLEEAIKARKEAEYKVGDNWLDVH